MSGDSETIPRSSTEPRVNGNQRDTWRPAGELQEKPNPKTREWKKLHLFSSSTKTTDPVLLITYVSISLNCFFFFWYFCSFRQ